MAQTHWQDKALSASKAISRTVGVQFAILCIFAFLAIAVSPALFQRDCSWAVTEGSSEGNQLAGTTVIKNDPAENNVVKEHTYPRGEKDPEPPAQRLEINGVRYELVSTESVDAEADPEISIFTHGYSVQCAPEDLDATLGSVPAEWDISEDGFQGAIPRVSLKSDPHYGVREYQADVVQTYSGLASNDVSQIPLSVAFTLETGNTQTLDCAGITWSVEGTDERGLPSSYCAEVVYRGIDQMQVVDYYEITAEYKGSVSGPKKPLTKVVATYELRVPETIDLSNNVPDVRAFSLPIWAMVLGGTAAAAACVLLILPIWRRKQCTIAVQEMGFAPLEGTPSFNESLIRLTKTRVKKSADGCLVSVPEQITLDGCSSLVLLFRKSIADGRPARVVRGDRVVFEGPLRDVIRISL